MDNKSGHNQKTYVIVISLLLLAVIGVTAMFVVSRLRQQKASKTAEIASNEASTQDPSKLYGESSDGLVTYNGKKYRYNTNLSNYLLLGIDTRENINEDRGTQSGGQADAIFLLSYDNKEKAARILSIPRDTMTMITVLDVKGNHCGQMWDHLSLQYAYGDGQDLSCRITCDTVSDLLYEIPIVGYTAINLESIPLIVDAVGGVTVTVPNDSLEERYPEFEKGAEVTLDGKMAVTYLQYRDYSIPNQALVRMERQKSFINGFANRVKELRIWDVQILTEIYDTLKTHMVSDMSLFSYLKLAGMKSFGGIETIPGEGVATEKFDEYHVDDKALFEMVLDVFYTEQSC